MTPEDEQYRLMDKMNEASLAYWNALLGINGIFITVFSALTVFEKLDIWFAFCMILASIVSSWSLIKNFKNIKNMYFSFGAMREIPIPEKQNELDNDVGSTHKKIKKNEKIVEILLFVQTVLIFVILFMPKKSG